jgi:hypothetical protein
MDNPLELTTDLIIQFKDPRMGAGDFHLALCALCTGLALGALYGGGVKLHLVDLQQGPLHDAVAARFNALQDAVDPLYRAALADRARLSAENEQLRIELARISGKP